MAARPTDWNILDLDQDPTPGDPWLIKDLGGKLRGLGDEAERAARDVRGLAGDPAAMNWIGASGDAFRNHIGKFPGQLDKVATSHHMCADALTEYGNALDGFQSQADRALVQARPLHDQVQRIQAQLSSANVDLTSANKGVDAAHAASTVDPASVQAAIRSQTSAKSAVDSLNSQLSGSQGQLDVLKKLALSAENLRHGAEDTARSKINAATDAGIPPDSFWHKLGEIAGAIWKGLVIVAKVVAFVGAIVLMVVGGPVWLIVAVVAAGVLILGDTLYKYANGQASLWDVGLAVLGCIPITKGITSLAGLSDAFRAGGLLGAGLHIGGEALATGRELLTGMSVLLKGGLGRIAQIFADGSRGDGGLATLADSARALDATGGVDKTALANFASSYRDYASDLGSCKNLVANNPALYGKDPELLAAVRGFTSEEFYHKLNAALRSGDPAAMAAWSDYTKTINSGLDQLRPFTGTVERGIRMLSPAQAAEIAQKYVPGATVTETAFTSTSNNGKAFDGLIKMTFTSKTGVDISPVARYPEGEILFKAGTEFDVVSKTQDPSGIWHIVLEEK